MNNKEPGYVYILTNPSFREDWLKIGKSSRPVDVRSKELDNTAVPLFASKLRVLPNPNILLKKFAIIILLLIF